MDLTHGKNNNLNATFTGSERRVIGGAYLERLAQLASSGELDLTSKASERILNFSQLGSKPDATGLSHEVSEDDMRDLTGTVRHFADQTAEVIARIDQRTGMPSHQNYALSDRLALGRIASEFALELEAQTDLYNL
jgi:hypothetical protein